MSELQIRDAKLIQYLNEAYGKEKELEMALQAHIGMAIRDAYKKRLKDHLKETKDHARQLDRRIKKLGGKAEAGPLPEVVKDVAQAAQTATKKAAALAQGPMHAARGLSPAEKQLKNAKTEYSEEHEESPTTPPSRRWPRPWATRRPPSSLAASGATRSAWPSSWPGRSPS